MTIDIQKIRADFPILDTQINGSQLVYFDNGASAQKPQIVIDAITNGYAQDYANVHRGLHHLSNISTQKYESTRAKVARFLNTKEQNIVFTTGSTEGLNLVAYSWAMNNLKEGDEILLSTMEHHANIVPWFFLRDRLGAVIRWVDIEDDGSLPAERVINAFTPKTKLVALSHMSNVTGYKVDIQAIAVAARAQDICIVVDGSQAAVHGPVDLAQLDVDFYAITGHKLYGPTGSGALYVREARYDQMRPFMGGGDMIDQVTLDNVTYAKAPMRFEAGTPGIVETIGLGVALDYLQDIGMDNIANHEEQLKNYAAQRLSALDFIQILGTTPDKGAIFTFTMDGVHAHDISTIVNEKGVAIRAGTHCAQPLMKRFGVSASCRASLGLYNTTDEIDAFIDALTLAHRLLS